jgi:hypothetical protein
VAARITDGAELVFADQLMEKGDPRGELIVVEAQLDALGIDHPRGALLAATAARLRPKAFAAWSKALKLGDRFELELGLPSRVPVPVSEKKLQELLDQEWIIGYRVDGGTEERLMELLHHPRFARARSLVIDVDLSWKGLSTFCSSRALRDLERLDLTTALGPRALGVLLGSSNLARLERLELGLSVLDDDLGDLARVAGLPALRSLHLKPDLPEGVVRVILSSPLARRLEEVRVHVLPERLDLPALRRLVLAGTYHGRNLRRLFDAETSLPRLAFLDLSDAGITGAQVIGLIEAERLPSLRRLDISRNPIGEDTITALRKRFGELLIATSMREPPQKKRRGRS